MKKKEQNKSIKIMKSIERRNEKKIQNDTINTKQKVLKNFNQYIQKFKENHPGYYTEYNKQYNKPYYEENKERILKMVGEKVMCEYCNKAVRKDYVHKHMRTPKHIKNVKDYEDKLNELEQNE